MKPQSKAIAKTLHLATQDGKRVRRDDGRSDVPRLKLKPLDTFTEREIDWLWYPYLARGELTIVEGDPASRKSFMIQAAITDLLDRQRLPSRFPKFQCSPETVVLFDCENDGESVLRRRFRYMGLDRADSVLIEEDPFALTLDNVDGVIDQMRDAEPGLIVFDTMNDYFDRWADTNKGRDVTQALQPFKRMASELDAAVVLIRHLTKSPGKAMYRGQGNISFVGKARIVIAVAKDEEDKELSRMAVSKINNEVAPNALEFRVMDRSTVTKRNAFDFVWGKTVEMTADQILTAPTEPGRPDREREHAKSVLLKILNNGPKESGEVFELAERESVTERTLRRAADELQVRKQQRDRKWFWELPSGGQK